MNPLIPITTLIYKAFQLTFKAFVFYEQRAIKQYKNFHELIELNHHLGLSAQDRELLKLLGMQQSFNKGVRYDVWANQQELQVFCEKLLDLYERVQDLRPIELQADYQQSQ